LTCSAISGVQGALYLLVLSVNSVVSFSRWLSTAPGELPLWTSLGVVTGAAAAVLLVNARPAPGPSAVGG
jgi:hypothetical protein